VALPTSTADGGSVTLGAKADAVCGTATGTCTLESLVKFLNSTASGAIPAGTNIIGKVGIDQTTPGTTNAVAIDQTTPGTTNAVQIIAGTTGGNLNYILEPAASDNHGVIKNGAGTVYGIQSFNNSATINYMRLYNAGTGFNGCNSATNILWEGHIPANTSDAGFISPFPVSGIAFTTGLSICVTGGYGQTNTSNATASAISLNVQYK
jgi:hypothetical protein